MPPTQLEPSLATFHGKTDDFENVFYGSFLFSASSTRDGLYRHSYERKMSQFGGILFKGLAITVEVFLVKSGWGSNVSTEPVDHDVCQQLIQTVFPVVRISARVSWFSLSCHFNQEQMCVFWCLTKFEVSKNCAHLNKPPSGKFLNSLLVHVENFSRI